MRQDAILFVAPPFKGHLNILYQAAYEWQQANPSIKVHFVVCGWSNVPLPIDNTNFLLPYTLLHASDLCDANPNIFNRERAKILLPHLQAHVKQILSDKGHDTVLRAIVYDFFCWEAAQVARSMAIPSICSIPAIPPATPSMEMYHTRGNLLDESVETAGWPWVSDGKFLLGSYEQWLWTPPKLLGSKMPTFFGTHTRHVQLAPKKCPNATGRIERSGIFACFGTVVTGNLTKQAKNDRLFDLLCTIYQTMIDWCVVRQIKLDIAIPSALDAFRPLLECNSSPLVTIHDTVQDQSWYLSRAKLFITHGGGNSVREAIEQTCPMIVMPFFGDQWDAAAHVAKRKFGHCYQWLPKNLASSAINVGTDTFTLADSLKDMDFAAAASKFRLLLEKAWSNCITTSQAIRDSEPAVEAQAISSLKIDPRTVIWKPGDLLFGTNQDRVEFLPLASLTECVTINKTSPFSSRASDSMVMPGIIDEYNDILVSQAAFDAELAQIRDKDMLQDYAKRLVGFDIYLDQQSVKRPSPTCKDLVRLERLWQMCLCGLDYFVGHWKAHVHFVLSRFDPTKNAATRLELAHILSHWSKFDGHVTFWTIDTDGLGPISPAQAAICGDMCLTNPINLPNLSFFDESMALARTKNMLKRHLEGAPFYDRHQPTWSERVKSISSRQQKIDSGQHLGDILGIRLSYPYTTTLYDFANWLLTMKRQDGLVFTSVHVWERGKIVYLMGIDNCSKLPVEVQIWPSVILAAFQSEYSTIYKPSIMPDIATQEASQMRRIAQHQLQDFVDQNKVLLQ